MQLLIHLAFEQAPAYCSGAWIMMCLLWNAYSTMKSVCFLVSSRSKTNWLTLYPALDADCMFSRAWRWLHVFPRMALAACFPALGAGCMFSLAWRWLHVSDCMFCTSSYDYSLCDCSDANSFALVL